MSGSWSLTNYGYVIFTDKTNSVNKLEFPAIGYRDLDSKGMLNDSVIANNGYMTYGFNLRCVRQ